MVHKPLFYVPPPIGSFCRLLVKLKRTENSMFLALHTSCWITVVRNSTAESGLVHTHSGQPQLRSSCHPAIHLCSPGGSHTHSLYGLFQCFFQALQPATLPQQRTCSVSDIKRNDLIKKKKNPNLLPLNLQMYLHWVQLFCLLTHHISRGRRA